MLFMAICEHNKTIKMSEQFKIVKNPTWEEYVEETKNLSTDKFIYRGQSNLFKNGSFTPWGIKSSFNRENDPKKFKFRKFLTQQLEQGLFETYYSNYEFVKNTNLNQSDLISRLYFLQHYGISTCLIDFTFDPLVALYFSLTSLKGHNVMRTANPSTGVLTIYPDDCYVSIYQINHKLLCEKLNINNLDEANKNLTIKYDHYAIDLNRKLEWAHLAIDLDPLSKINNSINNYNLKEQKGCFLLFDNHYAQDYDLITFIEKYCEINDMIFTEPLVTIYNIKYNSLFQRMHIINKPRYKTVFKFLKENNCTGQYLFNDYQGLKYDFNFFHDQ